ncbi:hypothetical protein [Vibrio phage Artemius]|nr:hypothetical protein [Vibrio phage Artemius]
MLNKFWKRLDQVELTDCETYLVKVDTFGLDDRGRPEYTSWTKHAEYDFDGYRETFLDTETGHELEDQYSTITHVLIKPTMLELQNHIHEQNVEKGWWNEPRCFSTMTNLFISENSEALEGDRRNLMDDKLPNYPMRVVEIADMCIRVFDYLGSVCNTEFVENLPQRYYRNEDFQWNLSMCSKQLTDAWFDNECLLAKRASYCKPLHHAIAIGFQMIREMGYDPIEIILEKHDFNAVRHDHKLENRTTGKPGAKAY